MLAASFRINKDNYYLEVEDNSYRIVLAKNDETRVLTEVEAKELLNDIFGGNKTFKEQKDGYDIYIDDVGNKRYFKDGKEDFEMFFYNNGKDALLYKNNGKNNDDPHLIKRFEVITKKEILCYFLCSALILGIFDTFPNHWYDEGKLYIEHNVNHDFVADCIDESNGIDNKTKKYLMNNQFIEDVLRISDDSRNYILNKKLQNITLEYDKDYCEQRDIAGCYTSYSNLITLKDESCYYTALAHEFVHLMQDDNKYYYIREASAEMMAHEYYGTKPNAYKEQSKNLAILMEMIGPKPVMELNFKGDTSTFEAAIYANLDKEKADRLLELFTSPPLECDNIEEIDKEVYSLLDDMSYNMTGARFKEVSKNPIIPISKMRKAYFNQKLGDYHTGVLLADMKLLVGDIDIDDINSSDVESIELETVEECSKEEFEDWENRSRSGLDDDVNMTISFDANKGIIKRVDDGGKTMLYYDGKYYTLKEANELGYVSIKYTKYVDHKLDSIDEINEYMTNYDNFNFDITLTDNKQADFEVKDGNISKGNLYNYMTIIPSLAKKFPDQVFDKDDKNILDEAIEVLDSGDKSNKVSAKKRNI